MFQLSARIRNSVVCEFSAGRNVLKKERTQNQETLEEVCEELF